MEQKKSKGANMEALNTKLGYIALGTVMAMAIVLCSMEYRRAELDQKKLDSAMQLEDEEIEVVDLSNQPPPPPPPPPPPIPPEELEVLEEDDEEEATDIDFSDQESDQTEIIDVPEEVEEEPEEDRTIYTIVEEQPEFPGGPAAMMKYISTEIKYPAQAIDNNIQGRAFISFTVEKNGHITDVKSAAPPGREVHKILVKEAKRVVASMPKWKPGKQRGKPVRVKFTVPVNFRIR